MDSLVLLNFLYSLYQTLLMLREDNLRHTERNFKISSVLSVIEVQARVFTLSK